MTIFVDASALIAIIAGEPDAEDLSDRLDADPDRLCSALSAWETVAGLVRSYAFIIEDARETVGLFLKTGSIRFVSVGEAEFDLAVEAYARFGKGRHPAGLNLGDCHAYACAKAHRARLLFKGDDFSKTDIAQVSAARRGG